VVGCPRGGRIEGVRDFGSGWVLVTGRLRRLGEESVAASIALSVKGLNLVQRPPIAQVVPEIGLRISRSYCLIILIGNHHRIRLRR